MELVPPGAWVQYGLVLLFLIALGALAKWLMWLLDQQRQEREAQAEERARTQEAMQWLLEQQREEREEQARERSARDTSWQNWLANESSVGRQAMREQSHAHREHLERFAKENREAALAHQEVVREEARMVVAALQVHKQHLDRHGKETLEILASEVEARLRRHDAEERARAGKRLEG